MYNHILSIILFTPLVGAVVLMLIPGERKNLIRWVANIFALLGFAVSLPLVSWFWQIKGPARLQVRGGRAEHLDPHHWGRLLSRHRWHLVPAHHADHLPRRHRCPLLLDRDRYPGQGILHLVHGAADRHARRLHVAGLLPVLRLLGSHAGAHVPADRNLGWTAPALRRHQVLPLHPVRLRADAVERALPLHLPSRANGRVHLQHPGALPHRAAGAAGLRHHRGGDPVLRILPGLRHQGPHVPLPHLVAGCPRGSPHRRIGHPRRRSAEDGHLRSHPLLAAVLPCRGVLPQGAPAR